MLDTPPSVVDTIQGKRSVWSLDQMRKASPTCLRLLTQLMRAALALALASAGRSKPARMAMMAITTNSSMSVKAPDFGLVMCFMVVFAVFSYWVDTGLIQMVSSVNWNREII